jgi:hypothetical protein
METPLEPTKVGLRANAHHLGQVAAQVGDFYDVLQAFVESYAAWMAVTESGAAPPSVYTGSSQAGQLAEVFAEPNSGAAQEESRQTRESRLEWELTALTDLDRVVETVLAWTVEDARAEGMSWEQIARRLEITRQGAMARYARNIPKDNDTPTDQ